MIHCIHFTYKFSFHFYDLKKKIVCLEQVSLSNAAVRLRVMSMLETGMDQNRVAEEFGEHLNTT